MRPAIVSGIATKDAQASYWPFFFLPLVTLPEVFAKENLTQLWVISFTFRYQRG